MVWGGLLPPRWPIAPAPPAVPHGGADAPRLRLGCGSGAERVRRRGAAGAYRSLRSHCGARLGLRAFAHTVGRASYRSPPLGAQAGALGGVRGFWGGAGVGPRLARRRVW